VGDKPLTEFGRIPSRPSTATDRSVFPHRFARTAPLADKADGALAVKHSRYGCLLGATPFAPGTRGFRGPPLPPGRCGNRR